VIIPAVPFFCPIQAARQALEARQFAPAVRMFESVLAAESAALNEFSADFSAALQGMAEELLATDLPSAKSALLKIPSNLLTTHKPMKQKVLQKTAEMTTKGTQPEADPPAPKPKKIQLFGPKQFQAGDHCMPKLNVLG
jgi:hypothetical protein